MLLQRPRRHFYVLTARRARAPTDSPRRARYAGTGTFPIPAACATQDLFCGFAELGLLPIRCECGALGGVHLSPAVSSRSTRRGPGHAALRTAYCRSGAPFTVITHACFLLQLRAVRRGEGLEAPDGVILLPRARTARRGGFGGNPIVLFQNSRVPSLSLPTGCNFG